MISIGYVVDYQQIFFLYSNFQDKSLQIFQFRELKSSTFQHTSHHRLQFHNSDEEPKNQQNLSSDLLAYLEKPEFYDIRIQ